jgi:hypothetical protein
MKETYTMALYLSILAIGALLIFPFTLLLHIIRKLKGSVNG